MRIVGLPAEEGGDIGEPGAAVFALAETITRIRLTAKLFEQSTFICGEAPLPGCIHG